MKKPRLFLDLDGVLADFDAGVQQVAGCPPSDLPPQRLWPLLARSSDFYNRLPWTQDGKHLWETVKHLNPVIVTGLPRGKWAEPQKRSWCARELGSHVPVLCGMARIKGQIALDWLDEHEEEECLPVLVDDRITAQQSWEDMGGHYVLHLNAQESLKILASLGFSL